MIISAVVTMPAMQIADEKIKSMHIDTLHWNPYKNKDILLEIGKRRLASQVIWFAMETSHLIENARWSYKEKLWYDWLII